MRTKTHIVTWLRKLDEYVKVLQTASDQNKHTPPMCPCASGIHTQLS